VTAEAGAAFASVPRTAEELAELEARYQPFDGAAAWSGVHVDAPRWDRFAHALHRQRAAATEAAWADAHDRLLRAAALDSAALDGLFPANTELTSMVLGAAVGAAPPADEAVEVVVECSRRALVLAGETAAAGRAVGPHLMAVLQDVITEAQASYTVTTGHGDLIEVDLPRRQYKPISNYLALPGGIVTAFTPASMVAAEMERLGGELESAAFAALHPVVQAAYAHYALGIIHPFADGNGRLARTVASIFLMRAAGVPLIVFAEQWPAYYQALRLATQEGDAQALADFVCVAAMSALDLAANLVARPTPGTLAGDLLAGLAPGDDAVLASGDEAERVADEAASALIETLAIELREALYAPPRGVRIAITANRTTPAGHSEAAYRFARGQVVVRAAVRAAGPPGQSGAARGADLEFVALVSRQDGDLLPVALRETGSGELLEVALDDAYPLVLEPAVLRIRLWAHRLAAEALSRLTPPADE
jgi:hypothetical protein